MWVTCEQCGQGYDDALCFTYCPHIRFISDEAAARKDRAMRLLGQRVQWATGEPATIEAVTKDGFVEVEGFYGQFAPSLFVPAES